MYLDFKVSLHCVINQRIVALQSCVPSPRTWVVCKYIVKVLSSIVISCVLNQSYGH